MYYLWLWHIHYNPLPFTHTLEYKFFRYIFHLKFIRFFYFADEDRASSIRKRFAHRILLTEAFHWSSDYVWSVLTAQCNAGAVIRCWILPNYTIRHCLPPLSWPKHWSPYIDVITFDNCAHAQSHVITADVTYHYVTVLH